VADQLEKLREGRPSPDNDVFELSWTRTSDADEIAQQYLFVAGRSVVADGKDMNNELIPRLVPALSSNTYPNVIWVDSFANEMNVTVLAIGINYRFAKNC
jgi:hypothetical protein